MAVGGAAQDERVEAVEGADRGEADLAALGSIGVDVGKMGKIRWQGGFAQYGMGMAGGGGWVTG